MSLTLNPPEETPSQEVLRVPELLENILSNLSMWDIIKVQEVSKYWKNVITGSPKLQQAMFQRGMEEISSGVKLYIKNEILTDVIDAVRREENIYDDDEWEIPDRPYARGILNLIRAPPQINPSYQTMHISQPPTTKMFCQLDRRGFDMPVIVAEFEFPAGLRLNDYFDLFINQPESVIWPEDDWRYIGTGEEQCRSLRRLRGGISSRLLTRHQLRACTTWLHHRQYAADKDQALLADFLCDRRIRFPARLHKFQDMLVKVEKWETTTHPVRIFKYVELDLDSEDTNALFT